MPRIPSISAINPRPRWQFYKITQDPDKNPSLILLSAITYYPSPIETLSVGCFFFFLANSSILFVGSAPDESKYRIGTLLFDSYHMDSVLSVTGFVYSEDRIVLINSDVKITVLSSLKHLINDKWINFPISFSV